jgi:IS5 family transposase
MLRQQYDIDKEFSKIWQLSGEMDKPMAQIDRLLCDERLFDLIEADLSKRYPQTTKTGRKSTPVEVIFRILVLKHLRGLSYEKTLKINNKENNYTFT